MSHPYLLRLAAVYVRDNDLGAMQGKEFSCSCSKTLPRTGDDGHLQTSSLYS